MSRVLFTENTYKDCLIKAIFKKSHLEKLSRVFVCSVAFNALWGGESKNSRFQGKVL